MVSSKVLLSAIVSALFLASTHALFGEHLNVLPPLGPLLHPRRWPSGVVFMHACTTAFLCMLSSAAPVCNTDAPQVCSASKLLHIVR